MISYLLQKLLGIHELEESLKMAFKAEFDEKFVVLDGKIDAVKAKVDELATKEGVSPEEKADVFAKIDGAAAKLEAIVNPPVEETPIEVPAEG